MSDALSISYVTPWFGESVGGAEVYCRGLARALLAAGHDVEIVTTCCRNPFQDWATAHLPPGESRIDGLRVRRFPPNPRDARCFVALEHKLHDGLTLSRDEERQWIENSINSDGLVEYVGRHRRRRQFLLQPYLYGTTWHAARAAGKSGWLIPSLHNEAANYLRIFDGMFANAAGAAFQCPPELEHARLRFNLPRRRCSMIRGGVDEPQTPADPDRFRRARGLGRPYLLSVGRLVPGKGIDLLLPCYRRARPVWPDPPDLVFIGAGELPGPPVPGVHVFGDCTDEDVRDAMAGCLALCNASFYEAFSLVLMECWQQGRPVIVNGLCDVTRHHCQSANGGLWFADSHEFAECVSHLLDNPAHADCMGRNGQRYVRANYTWERTVRALTDQIKAGPRA